MRLLRSLLPFVALPFFFALTHPAHALFGPPDKTYNGAGNWNVGFQRNIGKRGICYAHTSYAGGRTQIWIGSRIEEEDNKQSWFLAIYSKDWTWVKPDKTYRLLFLPPERKKVYWVDFEAIQHQDDGLPFLVSNIDIELANALAIERRKDGVQIFSADRKPLITLELTDSAPAIRAVFHCRQEIIATTPAALEQPANKPDDDKGTGEHFGTAFFVAPKYVLTNMHVIKGCGEAWVKYPDFKPERAYLAGNDETNDLALLRTDMAPKAIAAFHFGPRLGESSYAYGFPLPGLLSTSGNFTLGNVTSLSGINDDTRVLQTSTPVQPGNSGGPLLNDRAAVIGIVEKKLDAIMVASVIGDVPQNVNFAIQSPIVVNFLATKGVLPSFSKVADKLDPADIADQAKGFTVQVTCK